MSVFCIGWGFSAADQQQIHLAKVHSSENIEHISICTYVFMYCIPMLESLHIDPLTGYV